MKKLRDDRYKPEPAIPVSEGILTEFRVMLVVPNVTGMARYKHLARALAQAAVTYGVEHRINVKCLNVEAIKMERFVELLHSPNKDNEAPDETGD